MKPPGRKLDQRGVGHGEHKPCLMRYLLSLALCFFSLFKLLMRAAVVAVRFPRGLTKLRPETLLIKSSCVRIANTHIYIYACTVLVLIRRFAEHGNMSIPDSEASMSPYGISMESWFGVMPAFRGLCFKTTSLISSTLLHMGFGLSCKIFA